MRWTDEEDAAIRAPDRPRDAELAARLGRTVTAIQKRRHAGGGAPPRSVSARLAQGIRVDPDTGCHVWTGPVNGKGYGVLWFEGKLWLTHRIAWLLHHGTLPPRPRVLDHRVCDNPPCCNVAHLADSSNGDNIKRGIARRRRAATSRPAETGE